MRACVNFVGLTGQCALFTPFGFLFFSLLANFCGFRVCWIVSELFSSFW